MAYTLYAPQNVVIRTNDLDDLNILLQLPKLARFSPGQVLATPGLNVKRRDSAQSDSPVFTQLVLEFDSDDVDDIDALEENVTTWAQRCRLPGVRGQRLAVVGEADDDGNTITITVLIGSVVFYNDRLVTVDVSLTDDELRADLENLTPYVPTEPTVSRVLADGSSEQVQPIPAPVAAFSIDPAQNLPVVSLEQVVLSLIRIGTEAAPLLVARDQFDAQALRDRLDNLQLELAAVRANLG